MPANTVNRIVPQIVTYGKARKAGLGVEVVADHLAKRLGIDRGVMIADVERDSPAGRSGLQGTIIDRFRRMSRLGDIIVQVDRTEVNNNEDLYKILDNYSVGDTVKISFIRNGKERMQTQVTLGDISK